MHFEKAIALAKVFEQYAIFYRSSTHVGYDECETRSAITKSVRKIAF